MRSDTAPLGLKIAAFAGLAFLHLPILLIFLYAFTTEERSYAFPPPGLTTKWFAVAWGRPDIWEALGLSLRVASIATLIALILAAVLLGERIGRPAIWASLAGLMGVAFILGGQFELVEYTREVMHGTIAVLLSTLFYALSLILGRKQAQLAKPTEIMFFQSLLLTLIFLLPAPWLAVALAKEHWLALVGVTALSLSGQFLMSWSYARAEAQYLIPTEYSAFVWAILFGWVFFDEGVVWTTLVGAVLIIAGCLIAARSNAKLSEPIEATI